MTGVKYIPGSIDEWFKLKKITVVTPLSLLAYTQPWNNKQLQYFDLKLFTLSMSFLLSPIVALYSAHKNFQINRTMAPYGERLIT